MEQQSNLSPEAREIWKDAYRFHATFEKMGNSPEEWDRCCKVLCELDRKHQAHPLARALLIATYGYLEDQRRPVAYEEAVKAAVDSG